jgi:hypothetical protein
MSEDETPSDVPNLPKTAGRIGVGRPVGAGIVPAPERLSLRRVTAQPVAEAASNVTRLRFEAPHRVERAPRLFETLRIIDLARLRQSLRRYKSLIEKKGGDYADATPSRARLLTQLEARYQGSMTRWPDVVVIRRPATGVIETNFAILGEAI